MAANFLRQGKPSTAVVIVQVDVEFPVGLTVSENWTFPRSMVSAICRALGTDPSSSSIHWTRPPSSSTANETGTRAAC
jgi:hypothetical protein